MPRHSEKRSLKDRLALHLNLSPETAIVSLLARLSKPFFVPLSNTFSGVPSKSENPRETSCDRWAVRQKDFHQPPRQTPNGRRGKPVEMTKQRSRSFVAQRDTTTQTSMVIDLKKNTPSIPNREARLRVDIDRRHIVSVYGKNQSVASGLLR